jgi:hypothetical protein
VASEYVMARTAEMARRMKLDTLKLPPPFNSMLHPMVLVARADHEVAILMPDMAHSIDAVRATNYWAACLMRPTEVYVVADVRMKIVDDGLGDTRVLERNQVNEAWERGDREGIREALGIQVVPRHGPADMRVFPYEQHDDALKWLDQLGVPDMVEGAMVDYARRGYRDGRKFWDYDRTRLLAEAKKLAGTDFIDLDSLIDRAAGQLASTKGDIARVSLLAQRVTYNKGERVPYAS